MPTKLQKQRKALRAAYLERLDQAVLNAPKHLAGQIGSASPLSESLSKIGRYAWNGYRYCEVTGEPLQLKRTSKKNSANAVRQRDRENRVRQLYLNFGHLWGQRGRAKGIAIEAGEKLGLKIKECTVARYIKDYPEGI
jgi:hypothetical protein